MKGGVRSEHVLRGDESGVGFAGAGFEVGGWWYRIDSEFPRVRMEGLGWRVLVFRWRVKG